MHKLPSGRKYLSIQPFSSNTKPCRSALNSNVPETSRMEFGREYIGRLPGHRNPVFVRRRRQSFRNPLGVPEIASISTVRQSNSMDRYLYLTPAVYIPPPPSPVTNSQAPAVQIVQPATVLAAVQQEPPAMKTITTTTTTETTKPVKQATSKHNCAACGKYRSPRYHYRHPLAPGEDPRPAFCRKCIRKYTSSEESQNDEIWEQPQRRIRVRRRHRYYSNSSEEWSSSSTAEERQKNKKGRDWERRSDSNGTYHIRIDRKRRERCKETKRRDRSPPDNVRYVRHIKIDEERPRGRSFVRHRYGPFDGQSSLEYGHRDIHVEAGLQGPQDRWRPLLRSPNYDRFYTLRDPRREYASSPQPNSLGGLSRFVEYIDRPEPYSRYGSRRRSHSSHTISSNDLETQSRFWPPQRCRSDAVAVRYGRKIKDCENDYRGYSSSESTEWLNDRWCLSRKPSLDEPSARFLRISDPPPREVQYRRSLDDGDLVRRRVRFARSTSAPLQRWRS